MSEDKKQELVERFKNLPENRQKAALHLLDEKDEGASA